jgi:photosystem II stability/assembly factor-like uncharacterized protein
MKTLLQILVLIAAISSGSKQLMAQWVQTNGPEGGHINCFAVSGTNIFAGGTGGVFLSTNNGTNWTTPSYPNNIGQVLSLAVSGTNLFAGGNHGWVRLSTDNGITWNPRNTGLPIANYGALTFHDGNIFAGSDSGVFRSTNNGLNWTAVNTGLPSPVRVGSFGSIDTIIFAGTWGNGLFRSTNGGSSWDTVNAPPDWTQLL